ncbi:MAG: tetratricopeptide repeat protein [Elainellaceae cyanobacterium]
MRPSRSLLTSLLKIAATALLIEFGCVLMPSSALAQSPELEPGPVLKPVLLLQVEGVLEDGDRTFSMDGSFYDVYTFEGEAGQRVSIRMESSDFDAYLLLNNPIGNTIAQNDDYDGTTSNARIVFDLPETGTYSVYANSSIGDLRGRYTVTVHLIPNNQKPLRLSDLSDDDIDTSDADDLNQEGLRQLNAGQYAIALERFEQALAISRDLSDSPAERLRQREDEATQLNNIGTVYRELGQYEQALEFYRQALAIQTEIGSSPQARGHTLNNMGLTYRRIGQYQQALDVYQQALSMSLLTGDRVIESIILNNIGGVYSALGQYQQAIEQYQQALTILTALGDSEERRRQRARESTILNNMGEAYNRLGQYQQALDFFQQALAIPIESGDSSADRQRQGMRTGSAFNNIGLVYDNLGQYQQALDRYQEALAIWVEIGDRAEAANTLNNIGSVRGKLGQYQQALSFYQQALAILTEIGDRRGEANTLNNIGIVFKALEQPELAIAVLKQSVNRYEDIRGDIRRLTTAQQQSFTNSIASTYRDLADLLLEADRVLEAQRVLDLLKVQELDEYLQDVQRNAQTETGITNRPAEQQIQAELDTRLNRSIALSRELQDLESLPTLTPDQEDRLIALGQEAAQLIQSFNGFWNSESVQSQVALLRQTTAGESLDLSNYRDLQQSLAALDQRAVLLYPLVLDDRLELVLVSPDADTPIRKTVQVDRVTLNAAIAQYRSALGSPDSNPLPLAQELYRYLLEPLADELQALGVETILYAPDSQLRYIPLGALHDGNQWVVQQFRINNITAASLMDIAQLPQQAPRIFAGAFTAGSYNVQVGDRSVPFQGLEFAGREVAHLAELIPNTTQRLNDDFTPATVNVMNRYTIVHLATHASFVPGSASDSFILFGDGTSVSLEEVAYWRLPDVELVVLSACETGVGDELGDGREILGLGYQMQKAGADAAIASLWQVSDGGTQVLMDAFYTALNHGYSKAEALQRAQQALITSDATVLIGERGVEVEITDLRSGQPLSQGNDLTHPYYWAPFILIGNGL